MFFLCRPIPHPILRSAWQFLGRASLLEVVFSPGYRLPPEAFHYGEPLIGRNVRLLSLESDKGIGVISCSLIRMPLDEGVEYNALSYTWGDSNDLVPIRCEGK